MNIPEIIGWLREIEPSIPQLLTWLLYLNAIVVAVLLVYEERDPSTTLAWALALMLLPGVGLVFYLLFGRNWRGIGKHDSRRLAASRLGNAVMAPLYGRWSDAAGAHISSAPGMVGRISQAVTVQSGTKPLPCVDLQVFSSGEAKFARLIGDIGSATESIHLQYFIWESDELTGRVCDLLAEKARAGVEVRVLYDWVGSLPFGKEQLREVRRAGGRVAADGAHLMKLNYRNHNKIAVIDGRIAYTGGMNMGSEYVDGGRRYASWRDTHVRFRGPLVAELQRMFLQRWFRVTLEDCFAEAYFPLQHWEPEEGERLVWSQLVHSGAESRFQAIRNSLLLAITSAQHRVRVQSPYFVPDEPIAEALNVQSLAGVDVRLMMTGVPDKRIAWYAAFSYIDEFIEAGGRLLQYDAGFFHAKTLTVDGEVAVIGTTNFDIRSFALHDELSVYFFNREIVQELERTFAEDERSCHEVTESTYAELSSAIRFRNASARLWSRLL